MVSWLMVNALIWVMRTLRRSRISLSGQTLVNLHPNVYATLCRTDIKQIFQGNAAAIQWVFHVISEVEEACVFIQNTIEITWWVKHTKFLFVLHHHTGFCPLHPPYFVIAGTDYTIFIELVRQREIDDLVSNSKAEKKFGLKFSRCNR